ncbi:MAG TPA: hypothetical protein DCZ01_12350, partial [Elusimicrobia bacterium]|nr:hypothetical protein [Elusimicrobiota bacterium]
MRRLIQPAVALLDRLKYGQKAILMGLMILIPLIVTQYLLFSEINKIIAFTRKERIGIEYCRPLMKLLRDLQLHRGISAGFYREGASFTEAMFDQQASIVRDVAAVDFMDRSFGPDLRTTRRWGALKSGILALKTRVWSLGARESFDEQTALILTFGAL